MVQGSGLRAQGSGLRAQGSGRKAQGARRKVQGAGLTAQGAGRKVQGARRCSGLLMSDLLPSGTLPPMGVGPICLFLLHFVSGAFIA